MTAPRLITTECVAWSGGLATFDLEWRRNGTVCRIGLTSGMVPPTYYTVLAESARLASMLLNARPARDVAPVITHDGCCGPVGAVVWRVAMLEETCGLGIREAYGYLDRAPREPGA